MSFDSSEQAVIAEIVGMTPTEVEAWLSAYGSRITSETEDRVRDYLDQWDDIKNGGDLQLYPTESNFGVRLTGGTPAANLAFWVRLLLEMPATNQSSWTKILRA